MLLAEMALFKPCTEVLDEYQIEHGKPLARSK